MEIFLKREDQKLFKNFKFLPSELDKIIFHESLGSSIWGCFGYNLNIWFLIKSSGVKSFPVAFRVSKIVNASTSSLTATKIISRFNTLSRNFFKSSTPKKSISFLTLS